MVKDHTCKDKSQTCGDDQTCCPFGDGFVKRLFSSSRSSDSVKHKKHTDTDAVILLESKEVLVVEKDAVRLVRRVVRTIRVKRAACSNRRIAFPKLPARPDQHDAVPDGQPDAKQVA